jgi:hypothetical protein
MERAQTIDEQAQVAQQKITEKVASSGEFKLSDPLFRQATATDLDDGDHDDEEDEEPRPCTSRTASWQHKRYPDVAYMTLPEEPRLKWYDVYATKQSRNPTWMQQSVRGGNFDADLARVLGGDDAVRGYVVRRVMSNRVMVDDGSGRDLVDVLVEEGKRMRQGLE